MALDPGTGIHQQGKTGSVAFGETVLAKALNLAEYGFSKFAVVAAFHHALHHALVEAVHAALAPPCGHGTAQRIGLAGGESGRNDGQLHHLFLKNRYSQRAFQRGAQRFLGQRHGLALALAFARLQVGVHHAALDGAGPHNGHLHHQVVKAARLQARQHAHLGAAFNLEYAHGVGAADHAVGGRVFGGYVGQGHGAAAPAGHQVQGAVQCAQHAQGQHVHLHEAQGLQVVLVPFDGGAPGHGSRYHRHGGNEGLARQHEAAAVLREVARKPQQLSGQFQQQAGGAGVQLQPAFLQAFGLQFAGVHAALVARQPVQRLGVPAQRLAHVAQSAAGLVGGHGSGQCGAVAAVALVEVLDDFLAPLVLEIHIDVGRLVAFAADEALEQHAGARRVYRRDAQAVAHRRVGRRAAPLAQNAAAARKAHQVVDGEEVVLVAQLCNPREFGVQLALHRIRHTFGLALLRAGAHAVVQVAVGGVAGWHHFLRVFVAQLGQAELAGLGQLHAGLQQLGRVEPGQLQTAAQVPLCVGLQRMPAFVQRAAQADGAHHVLQGLARTHMHVHRACGHTRNAPALAGGLQPL